ncbi:hypothetical protein KOR42_09730 [Thalassoglobus neptunius]|uniref:Polyketide cyclase / dehydrase and lipid transport n=1 Tax=Thalassoglobus neptunius TaxID=1938619 RepID=A0A5C5X5L1_9PLAN|nr:hypothetical protein [Thalassoglobus neptunius]TWT57611.1 hypothetical protein KOR42_09730 [Thalassoglobus neptunius]
MALFEHQTELSCSPTGLFSFLTCPANISKVSDPNLQFKFVDAPEKLEEGVELEFQIVSFGQVHTLKHKIIEFEHGSHVVEEQLEGPMKSWQHSHRYESAEGGCLKIDIVEFEPPGGLVGFFLTEDKVIDQLENGFFYREERLKELISQGAIV